MLSQLSTWPRRSEPQGRARGQHHSKLRPNARESIPKSLRSRENTTPKITMPGLFIGLLVWFGQAITATTIHNYASTPAIIPRQRLRGNAQRAAADDERHRRILQAAPTATPAPTSTESNNATARPTPRPTPPPWAPPTHHNRGYAGRSRSPATSFVLVLVLLIIIVCAVRFLMFGLVLFGGCCTCCCERGARKDLNRGSVVIPVTQ